MLSFNDLGFEEITFDDIRQGDVIGTLVDDCLFIGEASTIDNMFSVTDWLSPSGTIVASENDNAVYRYVGDKDVKAPVCGEPEKKRRASFPESGSLRLLEDVGEWEAGLRFFTRFGKSGWFVMCEGYRYEVNVGWLHELFEDGKLEVITRYTAN